MNQATNYYRTLKQHSLSLFFLSLFLSFFYDDLTWFDQTLVIVNMNVRKDFWWEQTDYNTFLFFVLFSSPSTYLSIFRFPSMYVCLSLSFSLFLTIGRFQSPIDYIQNLLVYIVLKEVFSLCPCFDEKSKKVSHNATETRMCTVFWLFLVFFRHCPLFLSHTTLQYSTAVRSQFCHHEGSLRVLPCFVILLLWFSCGIKHFNSIQCNVT